MHQVIVYLTAARGGGFAAPSPAGIYISSAANASVEAQNLIMEKVKLVVKHSQLENARAVLSLGAPRSRVNSREKRAVERLRESLLKCCFGRQAGIAGLHIQQVRVYLLLTFLDVYTPFEKLSGTFICAT